MGGVIRKAAIGRTSDPAHLFKNGICTVCVGAEGTAVGIFFSDTCQARNEEEQKGKHIGSGKSENQKQILSVLVALAIHWPKRPRVGIF